MFFEPGCHKAVVGNLTHPATTRPSSMLSNFNSSDVVRPWRMTGISYNEASAMKIATEIAESGAF